VPVPGYRNGLPHPIYPSNLSASLSFPQPRSFSKNDHYWCLPLRFKPKYPPTTKPSAISSVTKWTQTSKRRRATKTDMTLLSTANSPTKLQQRRMRNRVQVITRTHRTMCSLRPTLMHWRVAHTLQHCLYRRLKPQWKSMHTHRQRGRANENEKGDDHGNTKIVPPPLIVNVITTPTNVPHPLNV
jgi:hypothetical protein